MLLQETITTSTLVQEECLRISELMELLSITLVKVMGNRLPWHHLFRLLRERLQRALTRSLFQVHFTSKTLIRSKG